MVIQATKASNVQLPPELIFDILSLLSIKSLIRFMCVSKSWHSLISSPEFVKNHLKTSFKTSDTQHRRLIFSTFGFKLNPVLRECDLSSALYAPMPEAAHMEYHMSKFTTQAINKCPTRNPGEYFENYESRPVNVLGSCNGLVFIVEPDRNLFLWNPSIGKYKRLPNSGLDFNYLDSICHYNCVPSYGFGYDELHDDYKVVAILSAGFSVLDPDKQTVEVYSLRTNSWERNEDSKNCPFLKGWYVNNYSGCTQINGKLHWTANFGSHYHRSERKIVSFDLANETFGVVEFPEETGQAKYSQDDPFYRWTIGVLGEGCLALVCDHNQENVDVDVWIMMEYGVRQSWTKVVSVRYVDQYGCPFHKLVQLVFSSKKGEILLKLQSKLVLYNPEDKSWRELNISNIPYDSGYLKVDMYYESLVLLDANDGKNS